MSAAAPDYAILEERIGYRFRDRELLARALTHMSVAIQRGKGRAASYQRLEFLGDRVLGLAIAELLVREFPNANEGEMSQRLAAIVRKETCAAVAQAWQVGEFLRMGASEARSGGRDNMAILGDVCESVIAAVFLDAEHGYDAAREVIERGFGIHLRSPTRRLRDAKTALQEWAQSGGKPAPNYRITNRSGPDHAPEFRIAVAVDGYSNTEGVGRSKREAEQAAALAFLAREGLWSEVAHA
jgi:ribonuclease-3